MITSSKNYTKKKKKRTDRTPGQMVKANLCRQNHTKCIHIHTPKKRKRKKIHIYVCIYMYIYKRKRATKSINKSINDNKL